ncbi:hypothetical protein Pmar_PMAR029573 [Perkinsus marinus ATCC 50983]|uniref:Uncharacterized protein n=1 Tax=Perkinsus marinus (strain ATCC 50983 / TXsc) TaxID=423536 RepID=C5LD51_PERM5|nr:hypothetical protein Pmar_PMAR029573 [Perkinsus marinus ATCC 50983]EER05395.1 hypothetical protein Pmar_PMAR029573 [Perkinsus marinus ATCC 50983]|eukprot:XP_002773579.1 hypothetical protein Pmar_PMAR029573 [Perkinsus marinus ATCC 50983]
MNAQSSLSQSASAFLDKNVPLKLPSNDELEEMVMTYCRRLTEDSQYNYNRNKLDPYWNATVYKVISIPGQVAAISSDPLRSQPFFEYIGNLKRIDV